MLKSQSTACVTCAPGVNSSSVATWPCDALRSISGSRDEEWPRPAPGQLGRLSRGAWTMRLSVKPTTQSTVCSSGVIVARGDAHAGRSRDQVRRPRDRVIDSSPEANRRTRNWPSVPVKSVAARLLQHTLAPATPFQSLRTGRPSMRPFPSWAYAGFGTERRESDHSGDDGDERILLRALINSEETAIVPWRCSDRWDT